MKLDIACGQRKPDGWKGIDIVKTEAMTASDIVHDLTKYPWPVRANSVKEAQCHHYVEHIPMDASGDPKKDGLIKFMNEVYRIMAKDATVRIVHPYVMSTRAFWDPTHRRFIPEQTWYYFNKDWREQNGLDHYPIKTNFEVTLISGEGIPQHIASRNQEYQEIARVHWWNVVADLHVELKKLPL
jgi:predicted SAM-dependent methyltransferase